MKPSSEWTKSQVDRLGDRLRKGDISQAELRLLDSYRRSFTDAYETAIGQIREQLNLELTGRPAKSTTSIIDKLQRESIRLSQMQDIAGCRVTVADIKAQDEVVAQFKLLFDKVTIVDRREHPSHGYRAVHVVVEQSGKLIEVQVRTSLQHLWAELSEKLSDVVDSAIKYGGGDDEVLSLLAGTSESIMKLETSEAQILKTQQLTVDRELPEEIKQKVIKMLEEVREAMDPHKQRVVELLDQIGEVVPREKGRKDALSN